MGERASVNVSGHRKYYPFPAVPAQIFPILNKLTLPSSLLDEGDSHPEGIVPESWDETASTPEN